MDNKHNSLNLATKICSDICPWTLFVPRASLSENCSLLRTDNVRGHISENIFAPNEGYCLYNYNNDDDNNNNNNKNNNNFLKKFFSLLRSVLLLKIMIRTNLHINDKE